MTDIYQSWYVVKASLFVSVADFFQYFSTQGGILKSVFLTHRAKD
jgi:hypothetical protein